MVFDQKYKTPKNKKLRPYPEYIILNFPTIRLSKIIEQKIGKNNTSAQLNIKKSFENLLNKIL